MKKTLIILTLLSMPYLVWAQEASSTPAATDTSTSSPPASPDEATTTPEIVDTSFTTIVTPPPPTVPTPSRPPSTRNPVIRSRNTSPPSPVNNLSIVLVSSKSVSVSWTAPEDDSDTIEGYDLRLSRQPLNENSWDSAIQFGGTPSDTTSGKEQQAELTGLPEGATLYIGIKAYDESGNRSPLSNILSVITKPYTGAVQVASSRVDINGDGGGMGTAGVVQGVSTTNIGEATVSITVALPNGLPSELPIYVNFVNTISGQSYGGQTVNGLASYGIPAGDYYVRFVILDTNYQEPKNPIIFHIEAGEDKDLGRISLVSTNGAGGVNDFTAIGESTGGVTKLLIIIIKMLQEILQVLLKTTPQQGL